jgi:stress response protein YsnF
VVTKEARVVEEITINKEVDESTETVKDSVKKMKVDVDDIKDKNRD